MEFPSTLLLPYRNAFRLDCTKLKCFLLRGLTYSYKLIILLC